MYHDTTLYMYGSCTGGTLIEGHFGDNISLVVLFFEERFSSLEGSKCIVGIILGPQVLSFVERFIILCPNLGESTIGGFTIGILLSQYQ